MEMGTGSNVTRAWGQAGWRGEGGVGDLSPQLPGVETVVPTGQEGTTSCLGACRGGGLEISCLRGQQLRGRVGLKSRESI